jgi:hypothetical protein
VHLGHGRHVDAGTEADENPPRLITCAGLTGSENEARDRLAGRDGNLRSGSHDGLIRTGR